MARKMPLSSKSLIVYFLDERRSKVLYPVHIASVCCSSLVSPTTFRELTAILSTDMKPSFLLPSTPWINLCDILGGGLGEGDLMETDKWFFP